MRKFKKQQQKQPIKLWLIEFTLTSGEVIKFYVKAISYEDAVEKADGYEYWLDNGVLRNKLRTFRLMP